MATYMELFGLVSDSDLQDKAVVAVMLAAEGILSTTPTPAADRVSWAASVIENPKGVGRQVLNLILAANSEATVSAILAAPDAAIQSNVDDVVDSLILAHSTA